MCTIFQACIQKSLYLPRFCYHVKLKLAGNCRLCFVEDIAILKPIIACATLIYNNAVILTASSFIFKARENIIEFLLINHPLDCAICDQGGECDSQDQYVVMGNVVSRFYETTKKNSEDVNISFILKLSLNKCINCSRCTRYAHDICGEYGFSLLGRGENLKISNYKNDYFFFSEIIGNMIDLCPVGAITLKNTAYIHRFWELYELKFIDCTDVIHPPIRIDLRGLKIIRILPLVDEFTQEEWISDTPRFNYDFFNNFKIKICAIKKNFKIINISWLNVFYLIKNYFFKLLNFFISKKMFFLNFFSFSSVSVDIFQCEIYKNFFNKFNLFNINFFKDYKNSIFRASFLNNKLDLDFLKTSFFLIFNLNIRFCLPIINFKIREKIKFDYNTVLFFGPLTSFNFFFLHFGNSVKNFLEFFKKKNFNFLKQNVFLLNGKGSLNFFYFLFFKDNVTTLNFICQNSLEILKAESNLLYKNFNYKVSQFFSFFNIFYETGSIFSNQNNVFLNNKTLKLTTENDADFKFSNVKLPLVNGFEKPSLFLNIFGNINDFTYSFYKFFSSNFKNDFSIINIFSEIFFFKLNFKISDLKKKYVPKFWIKQSYYLKMFSFIFFYYNFYSVRNVYFFSNRANFFNSLNSFYFKTQNFFLKKFNSIQNYIKINSIQWLF